MTRVLKWLIYPCCLLFLMGGEYAAAKSGAAHKADMLRVIGIPSDAPQKVKGKWNRIADEFAKEIDSDYNPLLRSVQSIAPAFTWGRYSHRLFFHWGFNDLPGSYTEYADAASRSALVERIEIALAEMPEQMRTTCSGMIWSVIKAEQARRNRRMMACIPAHDRMTRNAIASILYDTHLLGDYIEGDYTTKRALYPLNSVIKDIRQTLKRLKDENRCSNNTLIEAALSELHTLSLRGRSCIDHIAAGEILQFLEKYMPQIIRNLKATQKEFFPK